MARRVDARRASPRPRASCRTLDLVLDFPDLDLLADLPSLLPLGPWVEAAACGALGLAEVYTGNKPDAEELAVAERVCRRCPVRRECGEHAASEAVWGVWAGEWHDGRAGRHVAA